MNHTKILETLLLHRHQTDARLKFINRRRTRLEASNGYTGILIKDKDFIIPDQYLPGSYKTDYHWVYPNIKSRINTRFYSKKRVSIQNLIWWFNNLSVLVKNGKSDRIVNELYFLYNSVKINAIDLKSLDNVYKPYSVYDNLSPGFLGGGTLDWELLSKVIQSIDNLQDGQFITIKWGSPTEPVIFETTNVFLMIMPRLGVYK